MRLRDPGGDSRLRRNRSMKGLSCDRGVTLIETMIAVLIALIGVFGLGNLVFQATATTKNQGTEMTRAVIYSQDKVEKILSLGSVPTLSSLPDFAACTQAASVQPAVCNTTGITSVTGWTQGLLAGGSTSPLQLSCPSSGASVGYMDFLDASGCQMDACANPPTSLCGNANPVAAYIRQWQITDLAASSSAGTLQAFAGGPVAKQITVAVYSLSAVNTNGGKPIVIVTSTVSNPN